MEDTQIAPEIRHRQVVLESYNRYNELFAKIDTDITLYGKTDTKSANQYIASLKAAISHILIFLNKPKFVNIKNEVLGYMNLSIYDYITKRHKIKESIDKAYYITGIVAIDQAQKPVSVNIDVVLPELIKEYYDGGKE